MSGADRWARLAEAGSARALRFGAWFQRRFGRGPSLVLLWLTAAYYFVRRGEARRASREYLERLWREPGGTGALRKAPGARDVVRHFYEFAVVLFDRMLVWGGALDTMRFEHDGSEGLFELAESGRGAILLGAHLGSLDMLSFVADRHELPVNVVVFQRNAARIQSFFSSLGTGRNLRFIELDPGSVRTAFAIKGCLERGEVVAILADRAPPGRGGRVVETRFLGGRAVFPLAPFQLAALFSCPVVFGLCPRTGQAGYRSVMRRLAGPERGPRGERDKWARELLERYVAELEAWCRAHPFQWFNFYPFWLPEGAGGDPS